MSIFSVITKPTLLLDEERARNNLIKVVQKARKANIQFRPHFKTHQSAEIGGWFSDLGIQKITVSSVEMAQYFFKNGWDDILIAFPVNLRELESLSELAKNITLTLLFESQDAISTVAKSIQFPVKARIKVDSGAGRSGVLWDDTSNMVALLRSIQNSPLLTYDGILTHAGHTYRASNVNEVIRIYSQSVERMLQVKSILDKEGLGETKVSVGDTPGISLTEELGEVDEIRPGNFLFYDMQQYALHACSREEIAVSIACPVVAVHPERYEAVIYGGAIHLSKDWYVGEDGETSYGLVISPAGKSWDTGKPIGYLRSVSQEHGVIKCFPGMGNSLSIGDIVCVLPAHSCLAVQALRYYVTLDGEIINTLNSEP